jgi:cobalt-zinc-cadmium efflux system protein
MNAMQAQRSGSVPPLAVERLRVRSRLTLALGLTVTFMVIELAGGVLTSSLALVADAGHMATDVAALSLSLFAIWMASRPAPPERTFGYYRVEILAALANGLALMLLVAYVLWEAAGRFAETPEVRAGPMLGVAMAGLLVNVAVGMLLAPERRRNLNVRGAFLHVLGDILGSLGAISAAVIILFTGANATDPAISVAIAGLILFGAVRLVWETVDVLLETTPRHLDVTRLSEALQGIAGVTSVHDVHVWTVTSGFIAMSAHVSVTGGPDHDEVLVRAQQVLRDRFGIDHATLQLETPDVEARLPAICLPGSACALVHGNGDAGGRGTPARVRQASS